MKVNQMSAILAILLMLGGTLIFVPRTFGAPPRVSSMYPVGVAPITVSPNIVVKYPFTFSGAPYFNVTIDAVNITQCQSLQIGFTFNPTVLQVANIVSGTWFFTGVPSADRFYYPGSTDNTAGIVYYYSWGILGAKYNRTSPSKVPEVMMNVQFEINPALTPSEIATIANKPQTMMNFSTSSSVETTYQTVFTSVGGGNITPLPQNIINGTFTISTPVPPKYSGITRSTSYAAYPSTFSITWQDNVALSKYIFSFDNGVGFFTNNTATAFTSNPQTVSVTETLIANVGATVRYIWYANDSSNLWNSTGIQKFVTIGAPPTYSNVTHSTAAAGAPCVFSVTCSDKIGLSKYIFSFDNGVGSFTNNTAVAFTSNPQTVSVTKTLKATAGATIRFRWFFNNTANVWNSTAIQTFSTVSVAVSISPSSATKDVGQSQTFTSSVSGGTPPYSYQWYMNGSAITGANSSTLVFKFLSAGNYSIYLRAKDTTGIVGTSNTATITVNPLPTVQVSPTKVALDIGESWMFIADVSGGTQPYSSYQWYLDGSPVINATSTRWTFTPFVLVNRTVYLTVTDSAGVTCISNNVSVTVTNAMSPTISPLSIVMDIGESQLYVVGVSGGTLPYSYQWYQWLPSGSELFAGANETTFDFKPSFAGLNFVYVEITDSLNVTVDIGTEATVNPSLSVSVSPTSGTIDVGQSLILTSTVLGGTSPYSYQWYLGGSPVVGATSSSWTFTPISAGTYEIYANATDILGKSAASNSSTLTVNSQPKMSVSPASVGLDIGESWLFIANASGGTQPYSSYQWYLDGSPVIGATNSMWTYTPLSHANHTIYVTAADSLNFEFTSNNASVTVSNAMNLTISPVSATLDFGQSQKYTVSVSGGTAPYSYQWYQWLQSGCKPFAGAINATFVFAPSIGFNIIYVVVTDGHGAQVDWGATVTVNPQPSVVVSPGSVIMDIGMTQQFTSIVVNGTSPYTYQWWLNGSPVSNAIGSTWAFTPSSSGNYTVYVIVTDSVNFAVRSSNVTVTVNPPLAVSISPTLPTGTDLGLSVTLTSTITGGMIPYSYQWYVNGSSASGATKASFIFKPSSTGTYSILLKATDSFGFTKLSNNATIIVNPHPNVVLSPTSPSIPLGENQTFTATVTGGTPSYHYQWYLSGVLTAQTTVPTFTFTPANVSRYYKLYVIITDASGVNATSNTAIINGYDVAATEVVPVDNVGHGALKTVFGQGYPIAVNITAADPGYYSETFMVTAYANATTIASQNVTLSGGGRTIITIAGIASMAYGHYIISAYAWPVLGEVNLANNRVANSTTTITVTIPGDLNGDGIINSVDFAILSINYAQTVPPANANADINGDGIINSVDLAILATNYGDYINL